MEGLSPLAGKAPIPALRYLQEPTNESYAETSSDLLPGQPLWGR